MNAFLVGETHVVQRAAQGDINVGTALEFQTGGWFCERGCQ